MEAKNILEVQKFVLECNDMLSGKFLDLGKRLDKFLSVMTKSEDIIEFLGECLEGFDDEKEFEKAFSYDKKTGVVKIDIPTDDKQKLALFTTIFNNISTQKLNVNKFLDTYFQDKKLTSMACFLEKIVRPFRDLICKYFEVKQTVSAEDVKKQAEVAKEELAQQEKEAEEARFPGLEELLRKLSSTCNQILALLKFEKKRTDVLDDVEFVVDSILSACEKKALMVVNGLVIGLNFVSKKFKNIKHLVEELNSLIYDYYEFLAGEGDEDETLEEEEE